MNIAGAVKTVIKSKKFLFALGIIGIGTTVAATAVGTLCAKDHVEKAKEEKVRNTEPIQVGDTDEWVKPEVTLTKTEILKAAWKDYIPAAASAGLTIFTFAKLFGRMSSENAALNGLLSASQATVQHLQDKMVEKLGDKKGNAAIVEAKNDADAKNPPVEIPTKEGFLENVNADDIIRVCIRLDGREFKTTKVLLTRAISVVNGNRDKFGEATLNDFYTALGQQSSEIGEMFKWTKDTMNDYDIDIQWNFAWSGAYTDDEGHSWTYIDFTEAPQVSQE